MSSAEVNEKEQGMFIDYVITDLACRKSFLLENLEQRGMNT